MNRQSPIADSRDSRASMEAALSEARLNHAASVELLGMYPGLPSLVARAIVSRDEFAATIDVLEAELEGQCPP